MTRICKHQPAPTESQRALAAECQANGGNITADEFAHSTAFARVGMSWTRARANRTIRAMQAEGKWLNAHAHADGSIYVGRVDE